MTQQPTPDHILETLNAYQKTEALSAAIELELFSKIAEGCRTHESIADACGASPRGVRILCDYMVVVGLLEKNDGRYGLTPDAAHYLDRGSAAYLGDATSFLGSPPLRRGFEYLTAAVRKGGTALERAGTISPHHDVWVRFARGMAPVMAPTAAALVELLQVEDDGPLKVLDIAAGHGLFGITVAVRNKQATVHAVDWPNVLSVAQGNARAVGLADRYETRPGSAFEQEFEPGYGLVLMTNFLHHFDHGQCVDMLRKVREALVDGGRAVLLEYVPNEDRVSPPAAAGFALVMLATTPNGDAYTYDEYRAMLIEADFGSTSFHELPGSTYQVVIGVR